MCEMGDAHLRPGDAGQEFDADEDGDHPLRIQGDRREDQGHPGFRIQHRKGDEDTVDSARSTHDRSPEQVDVRRAVRRHGLRLDPFHARMQGDGTETGHEIQDQELLRPERPLHHHAEHNQGVHVEQDVHEAPMHEHVGKGLPPPEERGSRIEHREGPVHEILVDQRGQEDNHVDDENVPGYRGNTFKESGKCHSESSVYFVQRQDADDPAAGGGEFGIFAGEEGVHQALGLGG